MTEANCAGWRLLGRQSRFPSRIPSRGLPSGRGRREDEQCAQHAVSWLKAAGDRIREPIGCRRSVETKVSELRSFAREVPDWGPARYDKTPQSVIETASRICFSDKPLSRETRRRKS